MMDDKKILAYLADHPDFLVTHQAALRASGLQFPDVTSRPNVIDVTSKIASKARQEARRATKTNQTLLTVAAENMLHWQELHLATLGFLACNELTGFAQMVQEELPLIFGLASAHLIMARRDAIPDAESLGFLTLDKAVIDTLMGDEVIKMGPPEKTLLSLMNGPNDMAPESEAETQAESNAESNAESVAMMRLPDQLPAPIAGSLLVLGGRDGDSFVQGKGRALLLHLSEMVGVCLLSLIEAPSITGAITETR